MLTSRFKATSAAFFMAAVSVYAGPALGAAGDEPVEAVDLFDSNVEAGEKPDVKVGDLGQVSITARDTDITMVLRILSMQSKRNIIASRNVSGTVSANLYEVDFYDALDAILHPNGFGYEEKGNFIYVYTQAELEEINKANRQRVHKVVRLNYLNAADASGFVSPLLSSDGSISVSAEAESGFQPSLSDGGEMSFAHPDTLLIADYEENVAEILAILKELDVKPQQVMLEATVLQVRLTEQNALGIDFAVYGDLDIGAITTPLGVVDNLIDNTDSGFDSGQGIQTSAGNVASGNSGVKIGVLGSDASLFVRALDSVQDTNVLATPKILALNRQKAELLIGEKLGYLSTTVTDTSSTSTVEFLEVGTQLTVRPFISDEGYVRMELRPSVSDGDTSRVVDGNVIPDETTNELVTNVIVRNGQTVVLGGLFTEDSSINKSQLPGIGHIPVVGLLGKGQDDTIRRSEVIFLIKPTIMKDEPLEAMGQELYGRAMDTLPGFRKGLLPWSRTKLTAAHMAKAHKAIEAGDDKKALWYLNLALHLDPTSEDALQMKQRITGEKLFYHDRSMLSDVVGSMVADQVGEPVMPVSKGEATTAEPEDAVGAIEPAEPEAGQQAQGEQPEAGAEAFEMDIIEEAAAELAEPEAQSTEPVAIEETVEAEPVAIEPTVEAEPVATVESVEPVTETVEEDMAEAGTSEDVLFWEPTVEQTAEADPASTETEEAEDAESVEVTEVDPMQID